MSDQTYRITGLSGSSYYFLFDDADDTVVSFEPREVSGLKSRYFQLTDADIRAANPNLAAGTYYPSVWVGSGSPAGVGDALHSGPYEVRWAGRTSIPQAPAPQAGSVVDVGPEFTIAISRIQPTPTLWIPSDDETQPYVALDLSPIFGDLRVAAIAEIEVTPADELEVIADGPQGSAAILRLLGGHVVGTKYRITAQVTMSNGSPYTARFYARAYEFPDE